MIDSKGTVHLLTNQTHGPQLHFLDDVTLTWLIPSTAVLTKGKFFLMHMKRVFLGYYIDKKSFWKNIDSRTHL